MRLILANGTESTTEGRVEIFHDNQWGTLCDDEFDTTDASVICTMFNYTHGEAYVDNEYGPGLGEKRYFEGQI